MRSRRLNCRHSCAVGQPAVPVSVILEAPRSVGPRNGDGVDRNQPDSPRPKLSTDIIILDGAAGPQIS